MDRVKVTLDTNVLNAQVRQKIEKAIEGLPIQLAHTSVTAREQEDAYAPPPGQRILETAVWDESRWDQSVWGGDDDAAFFEKLLTTISHGAFPRPSSRKNLTHGQRNQLRDAMILATHVRDGRDIFVTNEKRAFIGRKEDALRQELERLCKTRIMTAEKFCSYCSIMKEKLIE